MSVQDRVLSTALELGRFTAAELSDRSAVNYNTVRSVLGRQRRYFDVTQSPVTTTGRPGNVYAVKAPDRLREYLQEVRADAEWVPMPEARAGAAEILEARLDAVNHSLRRAALRRDRPVRRALLDSAVEVLEGLLAADPEPDLARRTLEAKAAAELMRMAHLSKTERPRTLEALADAIATLMRGFRVPSPLLLRALLQMAQEADVAPPIGVIAHRDVKRESIGIRDTSFSALPFPSDHENQLLWLPDWSAALREPFALPAVVLRMDDVVDLRGSFARLPAWTTRVVMGAPSKPLMMEAARQGAIFWPGTVLDEAAFSDIERALRGRMAGFHDDDASAISALLDDAELDDTDYPG